MDKALKIYLVIAVIFLGVIGLALYGSYEHNKTKDAEVAHLDINDPMLAKAKEKAHTTLDTLFVLYPQHKEKSFVKFVSKDAEGIEKHTWGQLRDLATDHVAIVIKDPGTGTNPVETEKEIQLPIEQVEDWLVQLDSNNVRGGFTTQVILMRQPGLNNAQLAEQLKAFQDPL